MTRQQRNTSDVLQRFGLSLPRGIWEKSLFQIADLFHFDIIALQEVGGLSQGKLTTDGFLAADDPAAAR